MRLPLRSLRIRELSVGLVAAARALEIPLAPVAPGRVAAAALMSMRAEVCRGFRPGVERMAAGLVIGESVDGAEAARREGVAGRDGAVDKPRIGMVEVVRVLPVASFAGALARR